MASEPLSLLTEAAPRLTAFRWSTYDVPFWARPNTRDGRWHRANGSVVAQYWSLTPEAAWAELIRHEDLTTEAQLDEVRMPIWVSSVPSTFLVDLRRSDERETYEIDEDELISNNWASCQSLGEELRQTKSGVIAPSAALPTHANLTVFGTKRSIAWEGTPALASAIPTTQVAIGRPPAGLVKRVRRPSEGPSTGRLF